MKIIALIACLLPAGCASFVEVTELKRIEDSAGFFTKSLYYCGSTEACHFFEQETPLADLTPLSKHALIFKVDRRVVKLPEGTEFPRSSYEKRTDPRRQKMRIHITGTNPNRAAADNRVSIYDQY